MAVKNKVPKPKIPYATVYIDGKPKEIMSSSKYWGISWENFHRDDGPAIILNKNHPEYEDDEGNDIFFFLHGREIPFIEWAVRANCPLEDYVVYMTDPNREIRESAINLFKFLQQYGQKCSQTTAMVNVPVLMVGNKGLILPETVPLIIDLTKKG